MTAEVRRHAIVQPGVPLFGSAPRVFDERLKEMCRFTGLALTDFVTSPFVGTPIPYYVDDYPDDRRWMGVDPRSMWHPLMWLPPHLASRFKIPGPDDSSAPRDESDDEWAVRVCIEMLSAGLFDRSSSSWLDVLATVGINVDDPDDLERVGAWLDGSPDPALDDIDLAGVLEFDETDWGMKPAAELLERTWPIVWTAWADEIAEDIHRVLTAISAWEGTNEGSADEESIDFWRGYATTRLELGLEVLARYDASELAVWNDHLADIRAADSAALLREAVEAAGQHLELVGQMFLPEVARILNNAPRARGAGGGHSGRA